MRRLGVEMVVVAAMGAAARVVGVTEGVEMAEAARAAAVMAVVATVAVGMGVADMVAEATVVEWRDSACWSRTCAELVAFALMKLLVIRSKLIARLDGVGHRREGGHQ